MFAVTSIDSADWKLGIALPYSVIADSIIKINQITSFVNLIAIIIIVLLVNLIANKMLAPIGNLKKFASGDFREDTGEEDKKNKVAAGFKDEIEEITFATNTVKEQIRETILGTKAESDKIYAIAEDTNNGMKNLDNELIQIAENVKDMSDKALQAAELTTNLSSSGEEMGSAIDVVAVKASGAAQASEEITTRAENMMEQSVASRDTAANLYKDTQYELEKAIEASKEVDQIKILTDEILTIAGQTNLIASNTEAISESTDASTLNSETVLEKLEQLEGSSKQLQNIISDFVI